MIDLTRIGELRDWLERRRKSIIDDLATGPCTPPEGVLDITCDLLSLLSDAEALAQKAGGDEDDYALARLYEAVEYLSPHIVMNVAGGGHETLVCLCKAALAHIKARLTFAPPTVLVPTPGEKYQYVPPKPAAPPDSGTEEERAEILKWFDLAWPTGHDTIGRGPYTWNQLGWKIRAILSAPRPGGGKVTPGWRRVPDDYDWAKRLEDIKAGRPVSEMREIGVEVEEKP